MAIKNSKTDPPTATAVASATSEWPEILTRPSVATLLSDRQRKFIADWVTVAYEHDDRTGRHGTSYSDAQVLRLMIDWAQQSEMPVDWRGYHPDANFTVPVKKRPRGKPRNGDDERDEKGRWTS